MARSVLSIPKATGNAPLPAIVFMVVAMAGFAGADMFVKLASDSLSTGQIILTLGVAGTLLFGGLAWRKGVRVFGPDLLHPAMLARMLAEAIGTGAIFIGLSLISLSMASAIAQATPLVVTLGAGLILREQVGWRRWAAIFVGFAGVMIMLRPDGTAVNVGALFALLGVAGLSARDLTTRMVPARIDNLTVAAAGFIAMAIAGLAMLALTDDLRVPDLATMAVLGGMIVCATLAYFALTLSLRLGGMAAVAPFRYTRLIFAFALGALVFGDRLTMPIVVGALLVAGAGIYTFYREERLRRMARRADAQA